MKLHFFICSLVALVFSAHAQARSIASEHCAECPIPASGAADEVARVKKLVQSPVCPSVEAAGLDEAKAEADEAFPTKFELTATIAGRKLTGTSEEVTIAKQMLEGKAPDRWRTTGLLCTTVRCALQAALYDSEEAMLRALVIAKRNGFFLSLSQKLRGSAPEEVWRVAEVRAIDRAAKLLPTAQKKHAPIKYVLRYPSTVRNKETPGMAAVTDGAEVSMYAWAMTTEANIRANFLHEYAHTVDFRHADRKGSLLSESKKFGKERFVSRYALDGGADEDFAESMMQYMTDPAFLRAISPAKYDELKSRTFEGQEYPDLNRWPESPSDGDLWKACVKLIQVVQYDVKSGKFEFAFASSSGSMTQSLFPSHCSIGMAASHGDKMPNFCERGGVTGVARAFESRMAIYGRAYTDGIRACMRTNGAGCPEAVVAAARTYGIANEADLTVLRESITGTTLTPKPRSP